MHKLRLFGPEMIFLDCKILIELVICCCEWNFGPQNYGQIVNSLSQFGCLGG